MGETAQSVCLVVSLDSEASVIKKTDGSEIPFARAVLTIRNSCAKTVNDLQVHAELGQEGGTVQDVSGALAEAAVSLPAGGLVRWDVFDRLITAHSGTSSRVHMFGYRAVLNWKFELSFWAEYRVAGTAQPIKTPVSRWSLRWSVPDASIGAVELAIEVRKD